MFWRWFSNLILMLQQCRDFEVVFLTKIWRCSNIMIILFSQRYAILSCYSVLMNRIYTRHFAYAQLVYIWKFPAWCVKRKKGFLILCSSLIQNSSLFSDGKFGRVVVYFFSLYQESKHRGIIPICYYGNMKPLWIHFNWIFA